MPSCTFWMIVSITASASVVLVPKVKSAVIRLTRNAIQNLDCNEELFFKVVKASFNQRRKTVRNSVKSMVGNHLVDSIYLDKRAEQLSVDEFVQLTNAIEKALKV